MVFNEGPSLGFMVCFSLLLVFSDFHVDILAMMGHFVWGLIDQPLPRGLVLGFLGCVLLACVCSTWVCSLYWWGNVCFSR